MKKIKMTVMAVVIVVTSMISVKAKADQLGASDLLGSAAMAYVATTYGDWQQNDTNGQWKRIGINLAYGVGVATLREFLESKSTTEGTASWERWAFGVGGAALKAGISWHFH